jgi:integrase
MECGFSDDVVRKIVSLEACKNLADGKWKRFVTWCHDKDINPYEESAIVLADFLADFGDDKGGATNRGYKTTITEVWTMTSEAILNSDLIPRKLIEWSSKGKPPKAKYQEAYDIRPVLSYIKTHLLGEGKAEVRLRLILLLRICCLRRSSDVAVILWDSVDLERCSFKQLWSKAQKGNKRITGPISFEPNEEDPGLCVREAFRQYLELFKNNISEEEVNPVLIRDLKGRKPIQKVTISNLVLGVLKKSGIDTSVYKSHSLRMSAASAMIDNGLSVEHVMKIGEWSSTGVFLKFYHRAKRLGSSRAINSIMGVENGVEPREAEPSEVAEDQEISEEEIPLLAPNRPDRIIEEGPESL